MMGVKMIYPGIFEFDPNVEGDDTEGRASMAKISRLPPETRLTKRFNNFEELPGREGALEAAMAMVRGEISPPMLLLYGGTGRSKTHLALATGWCFLAQNKTVLYYHVGDFFNAIRAGQWVKEQPGEYLLNTLAAIEGFAERCALFIVDDLGTVPASEWAAGELDTVVDHRYENNLATIVTANTLEIPDRILGRMKEGRVVRCQGEDYREVIKKRKEGKRGES